MFSRSSITEKLGAAIIVTLACASASFVVAAAPDPVAVEPIGAWEVARVIGGLLVVVAFIIATAAGLKRLKSMQAVAGSHMQIIDGVSVSTRDRIVLLQVGDERVLVGVSPGRLQALHVFAQDSTETPAFADMVEQASAQHATTSNAAS